MPRGIAAYYAPSATPTSDPTTVREKAGVSASAISGGEKGCSGMVRYWRANATAERRVQPGP
jgi:hypothetical protein